MTVINGKVCLIVDASSGIGRALALQLARRGAILELTARREDRLLALKAEIEAPDGQCEVRTAGGAPALDMRDMDAEGVNHYMFPWPMRWLVRLALLLPGFIVPMILRQDVPSRTA